MKRAVAVLIGMAVLIIPAFGRCGSGTWQKIGGPAGKIYAGSGKIFATNPVTGDLWGYTGTPMKWVKVGGPGKMFSVGIKLYGISPDGGSVWEYTGTPMKWTQIGGPASAIYGGGINYDTGKEYLFATNPNTGDIWEYKCTPFKWQKIGGPGKMFATSCGFLWGISPDGSEVWEWQGNLNPPATSRKWRKIGGPASAIYANGCDLWATKPPNGDFYRYKTVNFVPSWEKKGGPGKMFTVDDQGRPYAISPDGKSVWRIKPPGLLAWEQIGGPAESIHAEYHWDRLVAKIPGTNEVYEWKLSTAPPQPSPPPTKAATIYGYKQVPYTGKIYYIAKIQIPNGILVTVKNKNLGLGKQWTVMIIKAGASSKDCGVSGKTINISPGSSTSALQGISLNNWTAGFCLMTTDPNTYNQGLPPNWALEITYTQ